MARRRVGGDESNKFVRSVHYLPVNSVFCFKSSSTSGFNLLFCFPILTIDCRSVSVCCQCVLRPHAPAVSARLLPDPVTGDYVPLLNKNLINACHLARALTLPRLIHMKRPSSAESSYVVFPSWSSCSSSSSSSCTSRYNLRSKLRS